MQGFPAALIYEKLTFSNYFSFSGLKLVFTKFPLNIHTFILQTLSPQVISFSWVICPQKNILQNTVKYYKKASELIFFENGEKSFQVQ